MRRSRIGIFVLFMAGLLCVQESLHAQNASQFPSGSATYAQNATDSDDGDTDAVNVIFFEIPDTITSTLYFGIYDPEAYGTNDSITTSGTTDYYLVGGSGALSGSDSQLVYYGTTSDARNDGTTLSSYTATGELAYDQNWIYFPVGVSPSQGEHIGSNYYFKIVVESERGGSGDFKNGYQVDVSLQGTDNSSPTLVTGAQSFAYNWCVNLEDNGTIWNLYPYASGSATGDLVIYNWDLDSGSDAGEVFNISAVSQGAITISGDGLTYPTDQASDTYTLNTEVDGTWELRITEGAGAEPLINTSEFWATVDGTNTRIYSTAVTSSSADADSVVLQYDDGTATAAASPTDTEKITIQVVDSSGDSVYAVNNLVIVVTDDDGNLADISSVSTGSIDTAADKAYITTDDYGYAWLEVERVDNFVSAGDTDSDDSFIVNIEAFWDGTTTAEGGTCDTFGTALSTSVDVTFVENPDPSISSASNESFDVSDGTTTIGDITITDLSLATDSKITNTGAGNLELQIRIPSTLDAVFANTAPTITGTASASVSTNSFSADYSTLEIEVDTDLTNGETLILSGLELETFGSVSSGNLELSWDSGVTFSVSDDKTYSISDSSLDYTWTGATDTDWDTTTNWSPNGTPGATDSVLISSVTNAPVLATAVAINELTINSGASVSTNGIDLTVSTTFNNNGTLIVEGTETTLSIGTMDTDSGTVEYTDTTGVTGLNVGDSYYNLEFSAGDWVENASLTVNNNLTIASGASFETDGNDLTITGIVSNDGTLIVEGTETTLSIGTMDIDSGIVEYSGAGTIGLNVGYTYFDLYFSAGSWTLGASLDVDNDLTIGSGVTVDLGSLTSGINVDGDLTLSGDITSSGSTGTVVVDLTSSLGGDITTDSGDITLSGAVTLTDDVSLSTGTATTGDIFFGSTIDDDGSDYSLSIDAGTGSVSFGGAIGTDDLTDLSITCDTALALPVVNVIGDVSINCLGALTQTGTLTASTVSITSDGGVTLGLANTFSTLDVTNTSSGDINVTNSTDLIISASHISQVSGSNVDIQNSGFITLTGNISAGTGSVMLDTLSGAVIDGVGSITADDIDLQTNASSSGFIGSSGDPIETYSSSGTTTLSLGGGALLSTYIDHQVDDLTVDSINIGTTPAGFSLIAAGILTLPSSSISVVDLILTSSGGALTIPASADLSATGTMDLTAGSGDLILNAGATVTGTDGTFTSSANITDGAAGYISNTVGTTILNAGGLITLDTSTNDISTMSIISTGVNNVTLDYDNNTSLATTGSLLSLSADFNAATLTLTDDLDVDGDLTVTSGTLDDNGQTVNVFGNVDLSGSTLTASALWTLDGTSAQSLTAATTGSFSDLTVNSGDVVTLASAIVVDGTLTISGGTLTTAGFQVEVYENWSNSATFTHGGGTVILGEGTTADEAYSLTSGGSSFYDLTITNDDYSSVTALDIDNLLTVSSGSLTQGTLGALTPEYVTLSGGDLTVNSPSTLSVGTGDLAVSGGNYSGDGDVTVAADITETGGTITFGNQNVSCVNITVSSGDLALGSAVITASGATNSINTSGTISDTASSLTLTGGGTLTLDDDESIGDLIISSVVVFTDSGAVTDVDMLTVNSGNSFTTGAGAFTAGGAVENGGDINVNGTGDVTFSSTYGASTSTGTVAMGSTGNILFTGDAVFTGGTLTGNATVGEDPTIEFVADVTLGAFTHNNDDVLFSGTATQVLDTNSQSFYDIEVDKSSGIAVTLSENMIQDTGGVLTMTLGDVNLGGYSWTLGADFSIGNATRPRFILAGGTLTDGTGSYNLSVAYAAINATTSGGALTIDGNFSQTDGTITFKDQTVSCANISVSGSGDLTLGSALITASGATNSINTSGTISDTASSLTLTGGGTLTLDDDESIGDLIISSVVVFTDSGAGTDVDTLTVNSGNSFTTGVGDFTAGGAVENGGDINVDGTGDVTFSSTYGASTSTGTVAMGSTGNILFTGNAVFTGGVLTGNATGGEDPTIEFSGNVTLETFTHNNDYILFSGATSQTLDTNGQNFYDIEVDKSANEVTLITSNMVQDTGGVLTMTDGDVDFGGFSWTLGADLSMSNDAQLIFSGGTLTDGSGSYNVLLANASAVLDASTSGGAITVDGNLTQTNGTITFNDQTVSCANIAVSGGDLTLGSAVITASGATNSINTSGTISDTASSLTLTGGGTLTLDDDESIGDLIISSVVVFTDSGAGTDVDTLTVNSGNSFTTGVGDFTAGGAVENGGDINVDGTGDVTFSSTYGASTSTGTVAMGSTGNILFTGNAVFTGGVLTGNATGGEDPTIEFSGNVTLGTFTHNNDYILFSGATAQTLDTNGQSFYDIEVDKSANEVTLITSNMVQDAGGVLTMTDGDIDFGGFSWTLGADLDINSATAQLTVNGGILTDGANGYNITLTNGAIDESSSTAGSISTAGDFTQAGGTLTLSDQTVSSVNFTQTAGAFLGGTSTFTVTGDVSVTGGTHTENSYTITFSGAGDNTIENTVGSFANVEIDKSASTDTISLASANALTLSGDLTLTTGIFNPDFGGTNYDLTVESDVTVDSGNTLYAGTETLTVGGDWTIDTSAFFENDSGTVIFNGAGTQTINTGGSGDDHDFYDFTVNNTGTLTLGTNILEIDNIFLLTAGSFEPGDQQIDYYGDTWTSSVINGFNHNTSAGTSSKVVFYNSGTISISGDNTFYMFDYQIAGGTIEFNPGDEQTVMNDITVIGSLGSEITLTSIGSAASWFLTVDAGASALFQYVNVSWSDASGGLSITPESTCTNDGNNTEWYFIIPILDSWTEDTDGNGRIDRIRARVDEDFSLTFDFTGFECSVDGYSNYSYSDGDVAYEFFIEFDEQNEPDTGVTPDWNIISNSSLAGVGGAYVLGVTGTPEVSQDNAAPVVEYALASVEKNEIFISFSEPVLNHDGGSLTDLDVSHFDYTLNAPSGYTVITDDGSGNGAVEVLITTTDDIDITNVLNEENFTINAELNDVNTFTVDVDCDLDSFTEETLAANETHRISDFALGLTGDGIMQPIYATDESEIDSSSGGIGLIKDFTGGEWLQDQDIDLISHINSNYSATTTVPDVDLYYDVDVSSAYRLNGDSDGMWISSDHYDMSNFYGFPYPANSDDRMLSMETATSAQLREYSFDSTDSELESVSTVEFIYYLNDFNLFAARIEDSSASNWYYGIKPWSFDIHDVTSQVGGVTILNNVINPENGETTKLYYELESSGMVTIQVFDISGAMVDILKRGSMDAGEYSTAWDGRNSGGRVVARGVYFIRLVAPDMDETRKVMVVK